MVVEGHLDSVIEGPGINDNGSGSSTILEVALQMAELGIDTTNRVRFTSWGAEEDGLIGSQHHTDSLPKNELTRSWVSGTDKASDKTKENMQFRGSLLKK